VVFTLTVLVAGLPGQAWVARSRDLSLPWLGRWIARRRRPILGVAMLATLVLGWGLTRVRVDPRIERLRPEGAGLALETRITERFGLARDVYLAMSRGPALDPLLTRHEALTHEAQGVAGLSLVGPDLVLPSSDAQEARRDALARLQVDGTQVADAIDAAAAVEGFVDGTFAPFRARLSQLLDARQAITLEELQGHGLGDVAGRFIRRDGPDYVVVTYATAADPAAVAALQSRVAAMPGMVLTGLPLVNAALAARFPRELALGLGVGAVVVLLIIWLEFRAIRPTALAVLPTICGLLWGLGALGWAGAVLDLFSVFALLMFLGIGVDYGIHLLHPTLGPRATHMSDALSLVGPAMLLAGATTIVGFGTLIWSSYGPLRSLGLTSVATIAAALVAALLVLPALVLTPEHDA
jgi:predicted exporter